MSEKSYEERQREAKRLYEQTAKRKCLLLITTSKSDDLEEWDAIVVWLKSQGRGYAKKGLYDLAKQHGIIPLKK